MTNRQTNTLSTAELKETFQELWGIEPHSGIGPALLKKAVAFKIKQNNGLGLSLKQQKRLDELVRQYQRNPKLFETGNTVLKTGMRLVRTWRGAKHIVLVKKNGFEYDGAIYKSLSKIAYEITGTRWNGYLFFGLKKTGGRS